MNWNSVILIVLALVIGISIGMIIGQQQMMLVIKIYQRTIELYKKQIERMQNNDLG